MVDKALFLGTSGAKSTMQQLEMIANNLANVNTAGFRGDFEVLKQAATADKQDTRTYSVASKSYSDFRPGPVVETGRDLDVAVSDRGFIAVQSPTGKEGYTRAGNLQIKNGVLMTQGGDIVMGTSGPINVGAVDRINIGTDGTVSAQIKGDTLLVKVNQIKLVSPPLNQLQKGQDGLFYLENGGNVKPDPNLTLTPRALEGSNVNPVETLTSLIELSREFEMHTNLMKTMESESTKANQILQLPA
jgi:flagellar basal-body rod protein FlgF